MRLWKGINKEGFLRYLPLVVYVTLTAFFLAVVYRVFLVYELKEIYTDMHLAPWALVRQTALEDFLLAFLIALPAVLLLFPESRARKRFAAALTVIFIFFYGTLLSASLLFVTIFEAPFQSTFFGQSLGTFQNAMFTSTLSELSLIPFRKAAPVFILMFATIVGFLFSRFLIGRRASRYLLWSAGFIFLFITLLTLTAPDAAALTEKKVRFDFKTIFTNPLSELSHYFFKTAQPNRILENQSNNGINSALAQSPLARYNTDSPTHARIFPRIAFQRSHKYNIVFYFLESTSYAYKNLKYNGMDIMPNLKALYEKGFATQKHYANFPLSINTFYTVLTAAYQYPDKNFIPCSRPQIPVPTIYETLKGAGFQTAVFHGSSLDNFCRRDFLKNRHVDAQVGFGELDKMQYPPIDATWQADDRAMINPFIEFMKQKPKKSKFAVVMPISPHHPYLVPSEQFNITKKELERNQGRKEQYWLQYINSLYFSDFVLGEFIKAMEKNHLLKNTVLFIFGDHGEAFYQHAGNYLHSLFVYEENVRVPFVILNPVLFPQKIHYDGISRMIDIAPTALDIVGVKAPKHYQGLSLLSTHRQQYALLHTQWADDMMGIVDGNNKYIYRFADGFEELYNLSNDPTEKNNLATHERRLVDQYRSLVLNGRKASQEFYRALH